MGGLDAGVVDEQIERPPQRVARGTKELTHLALLRDVGSYRERPSTHRLHIAHDGGRLPRVCQVVDDHVRASRARRRAVARPIPEAPR